MERTDTVSEIEALVIEPSGEFSVQSAPLREWEDIGGTVNGRLASLAVARIGSPVLSLRKIAGDDYNRLIAALIAFTARTTGGAYVNLPGPDGTAGTVAVIMTASLSPSLQNVYLRGRMDGLVDVVTELRDSVGKLDMTALGLWTACGGGISPDEVLAVYREVDRAIHDVRVSWTRGLETPNGSPAALLDGLDVPDPDTVEKLIIEGELLSLFRDLCTHPVVHRVVALARGRGMLGHPYVKDCPARP